VKRTLADEVASHALRHQHDAEQAGRDRVSGDSMTRTVAAPAARISNCAG
jgi:hypothetical protein